MVPVEDDPTVDDDVGDTYSVNQKIFLRRLRHRQQKIVADI